MGFVSGLSRRCSEYQRHVHLTPRDLTCYNLSVIGCHAPLRHRCRRRAHNWWVLYSAVNLLLSFMVKILTRIIRHISLLAICNRRHSLIQFQWSGIEYRDNTGPLLLGFRWWLWWKQLRFGVSRTARRYSGELVALSLPCIVLFPCTRNFTLHCFSLPRCYLFSIKPYH